MVSLRFGHQNQVNSENLKNWLSTTNSDDLKNILTTDIIDKYVDLINSKKSSLDIDINIIVNISVELVEILEDLKMDKQTIIASFFFPVVQFGMKDVAFIKEQFDDVIANLVQGTLSMAQIEAIQSSNFNQEQLQNIRNMLLSLVYDYRSMIIKIAERISYLRNIENSSSDEKQYVANQVMNIYAPLANRLGIWQLKWEIEDLCFRFLHNDKYKEIAKLLSSKRIERQKYIEKFIHNLQINIKHNLKNFSCEISGRPKSIYSIYKKMQNKNLSFENIYDLFAIRILVDDIQQCYGVLGVVHTLYSHLSKEFTDYIANPKANGYQSIHTIVIGPEQKSIEIQIRTKSMHKDAELGIAAHWKYKENIVKNTGRDKITWLRQLLEWSDDETGNKNNVKEIRDQLFNDRVYVFTPLGEVVDLPNGATPLDFAYNIHSEVGHRCVCAKVNGKIVNFSYQLRNGDHIEIITQKNSIPSIDWLNNGFVKTSRAKNKINAYFIKLNRDKYVNSGKLALENVLNSFNVLLAKVQVTLIKKFKSSNLTELYFHIGSGKIKITKVQQFLSSILNIENENNIHQHIIDKIEKNNSNKKFNSSNNIVIEGASNLMYSLSRCCQPIPGDVICGYITKGRGISIHRTDCIQLQKLIEKDNSKIINVYWNKTNNKEKLHSKIKIVANDYSSFLRDITQLMSQEKTNIKSINSTINPKKLLLECIIEIEFSDTDVLYRLINKLKNMKNIINVSRHYN